MNTLSSLLNFIGDKIGTPLDVKVKSGSKSVPNNSVTALDTIDATDTNAYYLIIATVTPEATVTGKQIQCRMLGIFTRREFTNGIGLQAINIYKGNGSYYTVSAYQDTGSSQTIKYSIQAVKLGLI